VAARRDLLPLAHQQLGQVGVEGVHAVPVVQHQQAAEEWNSAASVTRPAQAARIGVPTGPATSSP
jgi:hypothetical protein